MHRANQFGFHSLKRALAVLAVLATPAVLYAQSCPLCYQSAANSGAAFIRALRSGILVLLFPPLIIFAGVLILAYRKREHYSED